MNSNNILKADVLDIIFDNRNKLYGAYPLRKYYPERVKKALVIMFAIVGLFIVFSFLPSSKVIDGNLLTVMDGPTFGDIIPPAKKEIKQENKQQAQKVTMQKAANKIVAVPDEKVIDPIRETINIGSTTNIGVTDGVPVDAPEIGTGNGGGVPAPTENNVPAFSPEVVVEKADVEPMYPGGINALRIFLERNLTNPEELNEGEGVRVKVKFIVGYDGALKGFEIIQDGGAAFNNEVIRVLKKMPNWIPGKSNGRNVSVYHIIPVKFVPAD